MKLIDADALKEAISKHPLIDFTDDDIFELIDKAPTVEQRPQGEWKLDDTEQFCYCSNCEDTYYPRPLDPNWYYCPHCGADMRKGDVE